MNRVDPCASAAAPCPDIIIEAIVADDYTAVSAMVTENFRCSDNFRQLDAAARAAYIRANSPDGVAESCTDGRNIAAIVARDRHGGDILGYRLVRRGSHRRTGAPVAEGKRLHVRRSHVGLGIGSALVRYSCDLARAAGYRVMTAQASGNSRRFFEQLGFRCIIDSATNDVLAGQGIVSNIAYLELEL